MQGRKYPEALDVDSDTEVTGPYKCHYRTIFKALLVNDKYETKKDETIHITPVKEKNGWRVCPRAYISNISLPAKNVDSDETTHTVQADLWTPFGNLSGGITLLSKKGPRIGEQVESRTSLFGLSIDTRTKATPGKS